MRLTRCAMLTTLVTVVTVSAGAQSVPDGVIVAERNYALPTFDSLDPAQRREVNRQLSRDEYERLRGEATTRLRKVLYGSDGLRVVAYIYRTPEARGRRPVVVYARGSFVAGDQAPALLATMARFADSGYIVVAPQYRGSDGGEGRDEMGGADVADLHNALRLARSLPDVHQDYVYLYGESRGGMMVYQALRDGAHVAAAATVGAFTDLDSLLAGDPRSAAAAEQIWPDYASRRAAIADRRSAARWPEALRVPLLMLHGGNDQQVSPRQSERLAAALQRLGADFQLRVIAGGSHTLAEAASDRDATVMSWFRGYPNARPRL